MILRSTYNKARMALAVLSILLVGFSASANTTNTVPFSESFEGLSDGDSIVGTNGWYGQTNSYATATNAANPYGSNFPLATTHNTHIVLDTENGALTNLLTDTSSTDIWLDFMLNPTRWTDDAYPDLSDVTIDLGLFINSNGNPVVYHHNGTTSNRYSVIPYHTVASGAWTRVTIVASNFFSFGAFSIHFDGGAALTNAFGYETDGATLGGAWFYEANSFKARGISSIAFSGTGLLDDFVVTNGAPVFSIMWAITASVNNALGASTSPSGTFMVNDGVSTTITITASNFWDYTVDVDGVSSAGPPTEVTFTAISANHTVEVFAAQQTVTNDVPRWWLDQNGIATDDAGALANSDSDTLSNWQEWLASTDPGDTASTFEIIEHYVTDGTGYVVWVSKEIDPSLPPFAVLRSTNLTAAGGGWTVVDDSVSRGAGLGGTNIWLDSSPVAGNTGVYYRVSATN